MAPAHVTPSSTSRWRALVECMVDRDISRLLLVVGARSVVPFRRTSS